MKKEKTPPEIPNLSGEDLLAMYRLMLFGRHFTEEALGWYKEGRIPHGLHPSVGQEAIGVGACYGLRPTDWVIPSLRTTEAFWTRGVPLQMHLDTEIGNAGSISRGKETSHHAGYPQYGIMSGTAVVGGSIPVAVGAALALQMRGGEEVVLSFFGDGAANRGDFHEALNLGAILNAPVVFLCENNGYSQTVPISAAMKIENIADRALGYGIPGPIVDGQDVEAVYEATQEAVCRARRGQGPTLLELKTCRFKPHHPFFEEDRPAEELEPWLRRDPIQILAGRLQARGLLTDSQIEAMEEEIRIKLEEAIERAEKTAFPDPEEVFDQVYAEPLEEMGL